MFLEDDSVHLEVPVYRIYILLSLQKVQLRGGSRILERGGRGGGGGGGSNNCINK